MPLYLPGLVGTVKLHGQTALEAVNVKSLSRTDEHTAEESPFLATLFPLHSE